MSNQDIESTAVASEALEQDALASETSPAVPSGFATGEIALEHILTAALMSAGEPLSVEQLGAIFDANERPHGRDIRQALLKLVEQHQEGPLELREVASGWRFQVREAFAPWVKRLFSEKPQRYSRALLETLAIIAYRQPVTRGEIEDIRGVAVSTNIIRTLQEREWIKVLGHKELPGRPAMYGTTRQFLDYFNLKSLDELPSLAELQDLDKINIDLDLNNPDHHDDAPDSDYANQGLPAQSLAEDGGSAGEAVSAEAVDNDDLLVDSSDTVH